MANKKKSEITQDDNIKEKIEQVDLLDDLVEKSSEKIHTIKNESNTTSKVDLSLPTSDQIKHIPLPEAPPVKARNKGNYIPKKNIVAELDMELKIKFKKILWKMGHYGRIDVKIASYGEYENGRKDGVAELTDIDVWGFNMHDDFQIKNIIVDCKNGEKISPSGRIFWIKGVMEHVGNSTGYMVMGKKEIPSYLRDISNKFNISLMDAKNLLSLERIYNIDELENLEIFSEEYFHKQEQISEKALFELLDYRKYHYWIDEDHTKIHNILSLLSKNSTKLFHENKNHQILVVDYVILFTVVLLKLCSFVMKTSISQVKGGVLLYLYNGAYNLDKYITVLDLVEKVFRATAKNYDELKGFLDYKPAFYEDLVELCITILRRPNEAKDILRYLDVILYCLIMPKKEEKRTLKEVFKNEYNDITLKLILDIFEFVTKNTNISSRLTPKNLILDTQN